jgi:para-aminobenzoate synthetase component 1
VTLVQELTPVPDPEQVCERLSDLPYLLWLDSAAATSRLGQFSFVTADPDQVVRSRDRLIEIIDRRGGVRRHEGLSTGASAKQDDALSVVRDMLRPFAQHRLPGLPPFQGGAAGYLAYDWGRVLERLPSPRYDDIGLDDVVLGLYDWVIAWDHAGRRAWLISTGIPELDAQQRAERARVRAAGVLARLSSPVGPGLSTYVESTVDSPQRAARRSAPPELVGPGFNPGTEGEPVVQVSDTEQAPSYPVEGGWWDPSLELRSSFTRRNYLAAVARVVEYVHAGDIFQTNLSQRFEVPLHEPVWTLYKRLRQRNAAPFAAFMTLPGGAVLSASPERFLRVDAHGHVETRPIKGTRPRGIGPEHDAALGQALTESSKDRAENLMIVDLMRNDLSRVCAPGSVRVPELFALERYATVHHLVSTVVGDLEPGRDALDLLRAAFPGGSITGAPKVRAMEIIAELEPSRRSVYCGSIGYWSVTGELDTSIAIRTAVARRGRLYFNAGGGIVADSNPEQEYRETLDKARGIIDALTPHP